MNSSGAGDGGSPGYPRIQLVVDVMTARRGRIVAAWLVVAAVGLALLVLGTASTVERRRGDVWQSMNRRYFDDLRLAIGLHLHRKFPVSSSAVEESLRASQRAGWPDRDSSAGQSSRMRSWEFWRVVPHRHPDVGEPTTFIARFDDAGRPLLAAVLFGIVGGVAPLGIFWLGALIAVPALAWVAWECGRAGHGAVGMAILLLFSTSAYVIDALALAYSSAGYQIIAFLLVCALAAYANGSPSIGLLGLTIRVAVAGLGFAVCVLARSSCLFFLPGFVLAIAIALCRRSSQDAQHESYVGPAWTHGWRPWAVFLMLGALFIGPYSAAAASVAGLVRDAAARQGAAPIPQRHAIWFGIWTGLGDFDRTKGYVWSDAAALAAIERAGGPPGTGEFYDPAAEPILKRLVIADIHSDPAWYATILGRRIAATVLQTKLWPWWPISRKSLAPSTAPNEGVIDSYYNLTSRLDWFGVGPWRGEVPVQLLVLPAWLLLGAWLWQRYRTPRGPREQRLRGYVGVLLCLAIATILAPVLITTAAAIETQTFGLTYFVAAAFLFQEVTAKRTEWRRRTSSPLG